MRLKAFATGIMLLIGVRSDRDSLSLIHAMNDRCLVDGSELPVVRIVHGNLALALRYSVLRPGNDRLGLLGGRS